MEELEKAVYANATPEKLAQAVSGMPDEHKSKVATDVLGGLTDDDLKKLAPELVARIIAAHQNVPAKPAS
ncbi:unnamed protein product [Gemmata massiliana]|uniref:Uncharacterized protein n=1 Tax=Gemmata massiliana TaxID=1210884 RepID=A0A6P2CWE9_9BACT|nr:hypothetical protein [Gemmata massiliana]VTR93223.1 unnamed protein product [Gemmata massiliana]